MKWKRMLCRILTLGRHWWAYYPENSNKGSSYIHCRLCGKLPPSAWAIYNKMSPKYLRGRRDKWQRRQSL